MLPRYVVVRVGGLSDNLYLRFELVEAAKTAKELANKFPNNDVGIYTLLETVKS